MNDHQLFKTDQFHCFHVQQHQLPAIQQFLVDNPEYFFNVTGQAPNGHEAESEFNAQPPADMSFSHKWLVAFTNQHGEIIGVAEIISDFIAHQVWHIGLFIIATSLHGTGMATHIYQALESWMQGLGAQWIRLGVVVGNIKPESFWKKMGYTELKQRQNIVMETRINTVRVMAKSMCAEPFSDYLAIVERDRPETI